jgi:PHD/YefM family antitoxin component YafN of YafNO toxin-antitoxin module
MKTVAAEDTTLTAEALARMAEKEPVILTRNGQPLVAVKDLSGSDWESVSLANNPQFIAIIEESRRSYREQGGISLEEIRIELGLKPTRKAPGKRRGARRT